MYETCKHSNITAGTTDVTAIGAEADLGATRGTLAVDFGVKTDADFGLLPPKGVT